MATATHERVGALKPYLCTGTNPRTGHPCRTELFSAWAPDGAVVRRRCKQCGTWQTVIVEADPDGATLLVLD